jgi:hypothetical protein
MLDFEDVTEGIVEKVFEGLNQELGINTYEACLEAGLEPWEFDPTVQE